MVANFHFPQHLFHPLFFPALSFLSALDAVPFMREFGGFFSEKNLNFNIVVNFRAILEKQKMLTKDYSVISPHSIEFRSASGPYLEARYGQKSASAYGPIHE
jgi:hypothetical protein